MTSKDLITPDQIAALENKFSFPTLLETIYFKKHKNGFYRQLDMGLTIGKRNYQDLLILIERIHSYNNNHARSFVKKFENSESDWKNCEAIYSEVIVYGYYLELMKEGILKSINLDHEECDIILEDCNGNKAYLEIFCITPNLKTAPPGEVVLQDINTHTQEAMSSVRQKLLNKIRKQNQMTEPRDNYAVIELNDISIVGDFTVLSSVSNGYKVSIDRKTKVITNSGFDWSNSIFEEKDTQYLKGIIYFDRGDYETRRYILNPNFLDNGQLGVMP